MDGKTVPKNYKKMDNEVLIVRSSNYSSNDTYVHTKSVSRAQIFCQIFFIIVLWDYDFKISAIGQIGHQELFELAALSC